VCVHAIRVLRSNPYCEIETADSYDDQKQTLKKLKTDITGIFGMTWNSATYRELYSIRTAGDAATQAIDKWCAVYAIYPRLIDMHRVIGFRKCESCPHQY
jgi:hypothetical protein